MGKTTRTTPYRVEGCDLLLIDIYDIPKQRNVIGSVHIIGGVKYKITHKFHDCSAIERVT